MDKKEVRHYIRELKKNYTSDEKKEMSLAIWEQVETDVHFIKARRVLAYWSMEDEVRTHDFIRRWAGEKDFLLPCVNGDDLDIRCFSGIENLSPGIAFGIQEPVGSLLDDLDCIDLILVPGVAFDPACHRLGRGKGYYDRILYRSPAYRIGVCFDFQLLNEIPVEEHDVAMDCVISESRCCCLPESDEQASDADVPALT